MANRDRLLSAAEFSPIDFRVVPSGGFRVEAPPDEFYEMADAYGFLIWQDFPELMLASDPVSIAHTRAEAEGGS